MIGSAHLNHFVSLVSVVLALFAGNVAQAAQNVVGHPHLIEVFTTADLPVAGDAATNPSLDSREVNFQVYELEGIHRIEMKLSKGLTADPEQSKRIVLQRIQQLDGTERRRVQRGAMGLAKALQYGIDRYPAIVLDGEVTVYGVTEIREALHRYQQWREDRKR